MHFNKNIYQSEGQHQHPNKQFLPILIVSLLVLLWIYTAVSKISDLQQFQTEIYNQNFSRTVASILLWMIPISETTAAILLLLPKTRLIGLILSAVLMLVFTIYIGLVLLNYYDRTPCSCGGVLKELGWNAHFYFNLFFLAISLIGTYLELPKLKNSKTN